MRWLSIVASLLTVSLIAGSPAPAFAQSLDLPAALQMPLEIAGDMSEPEELSVNSTQQFRKRPKGDRDSIVNGLLIGLGIGAGVGAMLGLIEATSSSGVPANCAGVCIDYGSDLMSVGGGAMLGGLIGMGIGATVDFLRHDDRSASPALRRQPPFDVAARVGRDRFVVSAVVRR